jgi:hypothetical protein
MENLVIPGTDKCPQCGSEEKAVASAIDLLREEKLVPEDSFKEGLAIQAVLYDPARQKLLTTTFQTPIIQVRFDVCAVCHTMYCTSISLTQGTAQVQGPAPQHKARPPFRN